MGQFDLLDDPADDERPAWLNKNAAPGLSTPFRVTGSPRMTEPGNIDLRTRPSIPNADGSRSSVRSMSFSEGGPETLIPTAVDTGQILSDDDAIARFRRTGQHLGKFPDVAAADRYADRLHRQQEAAGPTPETRPFPADTVGTLKADLASMKPPISMASSFVAGLRKAASFGFGDELEGALLAVTGPGSYAENRDKVRVRDQEIEAAHPVASGAGELVGGVATSAIPVVGGVAKGAGVARAATQAAKAGAIYGAGTSEADLTNGDVGGFARDVATSAAVSGALGAGTSKLVRGAPERVDARLVANISRGEGGGAAKDKLYRNFIAKAGEEFADANEVFARHPGIKDTLATTAATKPGKGAKIVTQAIDKLDDGLTSIYKAIDDGPAVTYRAKILGNLAAARQASVKAGSTFAADAIETYENHVQKHFAENAELGAAQLRKMKSEIGQVAFKDLAAASTSPGVAAKRTIYGALDKAIEDAAEKTPGVDVAKLRELNKDASFLISVRDVLADRGAKDSSGRTSLFQNVFGASSMAAGVGGLVTGQTGLMAPLAAYGAFKGAQGAAQVGRHADVALAKMVQAARDGSVLAKLGQAATEIGVSRIAGEKIARRLPGGTEDRQAKDRAIAQVISAAQSGADPTDVLTAAEAAGLSPFEASSLLAKFAPKRQAVSP